MTEEKYLSPKQKALEVNLNPRIYGSFAEIGAGQEVADIFFKAGAASGTIAKTMSAYDMAFSDAIYGAEESGRYVCESRLMKMITKEYSLLPERLDEKRGENTCFFGFANTVEVLNYQKTNRGHGWFGVRFQLTPRGPYNDLIIHVRLQDNHRHLQQEVCGILGVNMVYACFHYHKDPDRFLLSLLDDITRDRMSVDMIRLSGPDFDHIDNRLLSLKLVKNNMTNAAMFGPDGNVMQPSEVLYKKHILALRGRFRPVTNVNLDMLEKGYAMFAQEPDVNKNNIMVISELTLSNLRVRSEGAIDDEDFLDRVDILCSLGQNVMISNFQEYFRLVDFFSEFNRGNKMGIILGIYNLADIFKEKFYNDISGGILEAFGKLFGRNLKLFVYPSSIPGSQEMLNCANFQPPQNLISLFRYLVENNKVADVSNVDRNILHIYSDHVLELIRSGKTGWENMVPPAVEAAIKAKCLFDYPCDVDAIEAARRIKEEELKKRS